MEEIVQRIGAFALAGLASGFSSGLFGVGGGIVRIPIFVYLLPLFGVPATVLMHVAVGTSMALVLSSALASTRKQVALGNFDSTFFRSWAVRIFVGVLIGTALVALPTILIAAPIGVRAGRRLSEAELRRVYTVLLFLIAADLVRKLVS